MLHHVNTQDICKIHSGLIYLAAPLIPSHLSVAIGTSDNTRIDAVLHHSTILSIFSDETLRNGRLRVLKCSSSKVRMENLLPNKPRHGTILVIVRVRGPDERTPKPDIISPVKLLLESPLIIIRDPLILVEYRIVDS